jgi:hypothetical protein
MVSAMLNSALFRSQSAPLSNSFFLRLDSDEGEAGLSRRDEAGD